MNFVGHLVDYMAHSSDYCEATALGAMWPDLRELREMGSEPRLGPGERALFETGLETHRRQDAEFHGRREFVEQCASSSRGLVASGLGRGPARAFSHVAYELRLDGLLLRHPLVSRRLRSAVRRSVVDSGAVGPRSLIERLNDGYGTPESVARVVVRILSRRPRLAVEGTPTGVLAGTVDAMTAPVSQAAGMLAEIN